VPNLERLLLAADDSPKGRFAARLAGLLAGLRGMPVTVLDLAAAPGVPDAPPGTEGIVRATAEAVRAAAPEDEGAADPVAVLTRPPSRPTEQAVAEEARRGHDLLVVGVQRVVGTEGGFHEDVARVAAAFDGPLALAAARGPHAERPLDGGLSILVPVTGAEVSRRGAEVALALARAADAPVTALSVARKVTGRGLRRRLLGRTRRDREALQREIVDLADRYGVAIRTATRVDVPPADAILRQARLGGHNLIVMGVSRRAGDALSFGDVAAAVLEASDRSLLYVAS
jgi:nucleotide-binding universal stress UspA family protein